MIVPQNDSRTVAPCARLCRLFSERSGKNPSPLYKPTVDKLSDIQTRVKHKLQNQRTAVNTDVAARLSADLSAASIAFVWTRSVRRCSWGGTPATRLYGRKETYER